MFLLACMFQGGTPNLSRHARAIPSAGFLAPWCAPSYRGAPEKCISHPVFHGLSAQGKRVCQLLLAPPAPVAEVSAPPRTVYSRVSAYSVGKRATATELDFGLMRVLDERASQAEGEGALAGIGGRSSSSASVDGGTARL